MNSFSAENWRSIVETAPEGIVVCDAAAPDFPVRSEEHTSELKSPI